MANALPKCLPVLISLLFSTAVCAQTPSQAKALDRQWAHATVKADVVALNRLLSDDLTYTHSSGETQSKAEFIDSVRKGELRYNSIDFESSNARVYGNTAVIVSRLRIMLTARGQNINLHPCFLDVWVKKHGAWQMVAHQATKID
jgi:ketosteroid isomerase-like protein